MVRSCIPLLSFFDCCLLFFWSHEVTVRLATRQGQSTQKRTRIKIRTVDEAARVTGDSDDSDDDDTDSDATMFEFDSGFNVIAIDVCLH